MKLLVQTTVPEVPRVACYMQSPGLVCRVRLVMLLLFIELVCSEEAWGLVLRVAAVVSILFQGSSRVKLDILLREALCKCGCFKFAFLVYMLHTFWKVLTARSYGVVSLVTYRWFLVPACASTSCFSSLDWFYVPTWTVPNSLSLCSPCQEFSISMLCLEGCCW